MRKNAQMNQMTIDRFGLWLQEKTGAELKELPDRTECVISIDYIEPGCFAALFVVPSARGLKVFELCEHFLNRGAAWQALGNHSETYPSLLFEEWVNQQYLTDRSATVEKLQL
jgi:hypothetical protein